MKICQPHWDRLRAAIDARGLSHLVAKSGEECVGRVARELKQGQPIADEYDPLMSCNWMIFEQALRCGGIRLMGTPPEGGEYCPICEAVKALAAQDGTTEEEALKEWIDGPADGALAYAREKGLVQ